MKKEYINFFVTVNPCTCGCDVIFEPLKGQDKNEKRLRVACAECHAIRYIDISEFGNDPSFQV